jgi:hypothetical protein
MELLQKDKEFDQMFNHNLLMFIQLHFKIVG